MVISSPCLDKPSKTRHVKVSGLGKDFSNPLMVESLPKTIWLSMHHVIAIKHWLVQSKQPWFGETAILSTTEEGLQAISATIDGHEKLITEDSLRRHLKLDDAEGISSLSNEEIFEQLAHMGSKKTAWDQFSSNIATALICLATSRRFNFSKFIFEASLRIGYPPNTYCIPTRFIELLLNKQQRPLRCIMEETASMPHDSPLHDVHSHGSAEGSVQQHSKETEYKLKSSNPRSKGKDFLSDDEEIAKDSSKQGGRFLKIYLGRWGKKKESEFNAEHKQELYKKKEEEKKKD
ncbi:hypothetical protein Tco_0157972 [Tanacetum coccineum]